MKEDLAYEQQLLAAGVVPTTQDRAKTMLSRYQYVVASDCPKLSEPEWLAICSRLNGNDLSMSLDAALANIWLEEDSGQDDPAAEALYKKYVSRTEQIPRGWIDDGMCNGVNLRLLARKVQSLSAGQRAAVVEVVEAFWQVEEALHPTERLRLASCRLTGSRTQAVGPVLLRADTRS